MTILISKRRAYLSPLEMSMEDFANNFPLFSRGDESLTQIIVFCAETTDIIYVHVPFWSLHGYNHGNVCMPREGISGAVIGFIPKGVRLWWAMIPGHSKIVFSVLQPGEDSAVGPILVGSTAATLAKQDTGYEAAQ